MHHYNFEPQSKFSALPPLGCLNRFVDREWNSCTSFAHDPSSVTQRVFRLRDKPHGLCFSLRKKGYCKCCSHLHIKHEIISATAIEVIVTVCRPKCYKSVIDKSVMPTWVVGLLSLSRTENAHGHVAINTSAINSNCVI